MLIMHDNYANIMDRLLINKKNILLLTTVGTLEAYCWCCWLFIHRIPYFTTLLNYIGYLFDVFVRRHAVHRVLSRVVKFRFVNFL